MPDIRELKDQATKLFSKGKYEKAASIYGELCRLEPKDMQMRVRLGDACVKHGDKTGAIEAYRFAAEAYAREGFLPRAIAVCKLILELEPAHVATQQTLAQLYARKSGRPLDDAPAASRAAPKAAAVAAAVAAAAAPAPRPAAAPAAPAAKPAARPAPAAPAPSADMPSVSAADSIELDDGSRTFSEGVASSSSSEGTSIEPSGLELDTGEQAADWKGAPAWGSGSGAHLKPPAEGAAPPAPRPPPPPPAAPAAPAAEEVSFELELSAEEMALPAVPANVELESPAAGAELPAAAVPAEPEQPPTPAASAQAPAAQEKPAGDDVLFEGTGAPKSPFSLGDMDLGEPELVDVGSPPELPSAPAHRPVQGSESWWAPPENDLPQTLADLGIASVDEEQQVELLTASTDVPLDAAALPEIPLFSDLSREAFVDLASRCKLLRPAAGEVIVEEGSVGSSFFVVSSGSVRVVKRRPEGDDLIVARLGEGAFFGEMALISGAARTASVVAEEDTDLLEISAALLADLQRRYPHVGQVLKKFCRQRLLANVMATSPLFKPFAKEERNALVERFKARDVGEGDVVLREGALSDGLFVVMSGELEVSKRKGEESVRLAALKEGDLFGEISLLTKSGATATITATRHSTLLRLPRESFDEVISTHPQVLMLVSELSDERLQIQQAVEAGTLVDGDEGLMLV